MPTKPQVLAAIPLFSLLDKTERVALARVIDERDCPANHELFCMGDRGDCMYFVRRGAVEIALTDDAGQKIVLNVLHEGDLFGELAIAENATRTATARTLEPCKLLVLDRDDLRQFIRLHPDGALDLMAMMSQRLRESGELLRRRVVRNANTEVADQSTLVQRIADAIAEFSGTIAFLALNALLFAVWIILNLNLLPGLQAFDPYPFGFLTMAVSLEAIFLSIFVLISQNRTAAKDRIRADLDYEVNVRAEKEIAQLHAKMDSIMKRLAQIEQAQAEHLRESARRR